MVGIMALADIDRDGYQELINTVGLL